MNFGMLGALAGAGNAMNTIGQEQQKTFDAKELLQEHNRMEMEKEARIGEAKARADELAYTHQKETEQRGILNAKATAQGNIDIANDPKNIANDISRKKQESNADYGIKDAHFETELSQATKLSNVKTNDQIRVGNETYHDTTDYEGRKADANLKAAQIDQIKAAGKYPAAVHDAMDANVKMIQGYQRDSALTDDPLTKDKYEKLIAKTVQQNNELLAPYLNKSANPQTSNPEIDIINGVNKGKNLSQDQVDNIVNDAAKINDIDPSLIKAISNVESGGKHYSDDGKVIRPLDKDGKPLSSAVGTMQVLENLHTEYPKEVLRDHEGNIRSGADLLGKLYANAPSEYSDRDKIRYTARRYYGSKNEDENNKYADKVLSDYDQQKANPKQVSKKENTDKVRESLLKEAARLNPNFDVTGLSNKDLQIAINRGNGRPNDFGEGLLNRARYNDTADGRL